MKQTAIDWLIDQIKDDQFNKVKTNLEWSKIFEQAKEMEKEQSQNYAIFVIHCDRNNLPVLTFESFIKL